MSTKPFFGFFLFAKLESRLELHKKRINVFWEQLYVLKRRVFFKQLFSNCDNNLNVLVLSLNPNYTSIKFFNIPRNVCFHVSMNNFPKTLLFTDVNRLLNSYW